MSKGFCTAMPDRIRSNASDGQFIEDIKVGDTIRVMVLKVTSLLLVTANLLGTWVDSLAHP